MKLSLFDFDNTLVETPYEDSPYLDTPESLDPNIWNFKFNKETIKEYFNESSNNSTITVLLTNRIDSVEENVLDILDNEKVIFDEKMFIEGKEGDRSKGKRLEKLLRKYPETTEIEYWEDKDKHIKDVVSTCEKYPDIKLNINKIIT
jgi:hypothetical protein|tara:strand:+ start:505 stop:945 length:441 start_codon:yes stop_codon:yes gene_type:complete